MVHSKVTGKGQTTIPGKIRKALRIKPGDSLEYMVRAITPSFASIRGRGR
jgi:AbrB family looped-hinge helix DNA binding protein